MAEFPDAFRFRSEFDMGFVFEVEAEVEVDAFKAEVEVEAFKAVFEVDAEGVTGLEFLGVGGREDFVFELCPGVGGCELLGVGGFEVGRDELMALERVTGVERAIYWVEGRAGRGPGGIWWMVNGGVKM